MTLADSTASTIDNSIYVMQSPTYVLVQLSHLLCSSKHATLIVSSHVSTVPCWLC